MASTLRQQIQPYLDLAYHVKTWMKVDPKTFMGPYQEHMYTFDGWIELLNICGDLRYPSSNQASSWWQNGGDPLLEVEFFTELSDPPIETVRLLGSFAQPFLREMRARNLTTDHVAHRIYQHLHDLAEAANKHEYAATTAVEYGHDLCRFDTTANQHSTGNTNAPTN